MQGQPNERSNVKKTPIMIFPKITESQECEDKRERIYKLASKFVIQL